MNRANKIKLLDSIFNNDDLASLKSLKSGVTVFVNIKEDQRIKRTTIDGNNIEVYNHSFDEIEILRLKLLNNYSIIWIENKTYEKVAKRNPSLSENNLRNLTNISER